MDLLFRSLEAHHRGLHMTGSTPKSQSRIVSPQITTAATWKPHLRTQYRLQLSQQLPDTTTNTTTSKDSQGKVCQQILQGLKCDSLWNKRVKTKHKACWRDRAGCKSSTELPNDKDFHRWLVTLIFYPETSCSLKATLPSKCKRSLTQRKKKNQHSFCIHDLLGNLWSRQKPVSPLLHKPLIPWSHF